MAFKWVLLADVKDFLRGTKDVEKELDNLSESMDEMAKETAVGAEKAADAIEGKVVAAIKKVEKEASTSKAGKRLADGTSEGLQDFKQEAGETAREVAQSFDGSVESIAGGFQELSAQAFRGFGPAGAAAGIAAALGLGVLTTELEKQKQKADEVKQEIQDLTTELAEVGGQWDKLNNAARVFDFLNKSIESTGQSLHDTYADLIESQLIGWGDIGAAVAGGVASYEKIRRKLVQVANDTTRLDKSGEERRIADERAQRAVELIKILDDQFTVQSKAAGATDDYTAAQHGATRATDDRLTSEERNAQALEDSVKAMEDAKRAAEQYADSLSDNMNVALGEVKDLNKDGETSLSEWTKTLRQKAQENKNIEWVVGKLEGQITDEALNSFKGMSPEDQAKIYQWYKDNPSAVKLNLEAAVGNVDWGKDGKPKLTDQAKADLESANAPKVEFMGQMKSDWEVPVVAGAKSDAQTEADKAGNEIEFQPKMDTSELQRVVNRAAAGITPPTIYPQIKIPKTVP